VIKQYQVKISGKKAGFHDITEELLKSVDFPQTGLAHFFLKHTSAGLLITENASPSVWIDLKNWVEELAPEDREYHHDEEGPDDMPAHLKSLLTGCELTIPIQNGKLALGKWQGIFLAEFRRASPSREILISIHS
jgi:secondary thiamine-phosphate synthase enzyme